MSATESPESENGRLLLRLAESLRQGTSLSEDETLAAAGALAEADPSIEEKEGFLRALAHKGETASEVAGFARAFRSKALDPGLADLSADAIDIVGTGGDRSGTFNFSTATALLVASLGVPVMKHGNRSITSKSGSADLLAALGVALDADTARLRESLERFRFCFFFAPAFHPAFKEIMPVRKRIAASGERTIFNLLGPLINPGRPAHQLMGVFSAAWAEPIAASLDGIGLDSALTVHCATGPTAGADELTVAGDNLILGSGRLKGADFASAPEAYGLDRADIADLRGGEAGRNLTLLRELAGNRAPPPMEDTLCLNAGAALLIAGRCEGIEEGIGTARAALRDGSFRRWLANFEEFNSHSK